MGKTARYIADKLGGFNPWFVGGGVKCMPARPYMFLDSEFQSLVCWRGC